MASKRIEKAYQSFDKTQILAIKDAIELSKKLVTEKCNPAIDIVFTLGIPKGESVRGALTPEHGTGKQVKVAVFAQGKQAEEAGEADLVGAAELVEKIQAGDFDADVVIATPDMMGLVGKVGRILGPKGLMPNPKLGTVTTDVAQAVKNAKSGQIFFRTDSAGALHARIGPASFETSKLMDTVKALVAELKRLKPARAKGQYIRSCYVSSTMGPGIRVDIHTLD